jgi:hypothetical protein
VTASKIPSWSQFKAVAAGILTMLLVTLLQAGESVIPTSPVLNPSAIFSTENHDKGLSRVKRKTDQ